MRHWLFGTRAIQTREVFEREEPVLLVVNDADDDLWQLIGSSDAGPDGKLGHLYHAVDEDPTLIDVLDLEPGRRRSATPSAARGPAASTSRADSSGGPLGHVASAEALGLLDEHLEER